MFKGGGEGEKGGERKGRRRRGGGEGGKEGEGMEKEKRENSLSIS